MFLGQYNKNFLKNAFLPLEEWQPFPPASNRTAWNKLLTSPLNQHKKDRFMEQANAIVNSAWPQLPASLYMEFYRNGNRKRYETPYFERRQRLAILVLAECMTFENNFIDEIANGIWCILEELTWCIPAHAHRLPNDPLPTHEMESVDLFACETAMILAETLYLLRQPLENLSPSLCERLQQAVVNRVIVPAEKRTDFHWLSGNNNWTPWCISNVIGASMYLLNSTERLASLCSKLLPSIDLFIANYGDDGGCDEGPMYWGFAAGAMLLLLELLYSRSNGKIDVYDMPQIRSMGRFITDAHLAGPWFVNFADTPAIVKLKHAVVYKYGQRIGNKNMQNLALLAAQSWSENNSFTTLLDQQLCLTHMLRDLFWIPVDAKPNELQPTKCTWFPDLQVMIAREYCADAKGIVLAAKGGHNEENHNHNDVGQFIILIDGQPGVIDIGVETYSKKTFSDSRYDIWCIRSNGHNVPKINGFEQCAGANFRAKNVEFTESSSRHSLTMDIKDAYPGDAGILLLRREFIFNQGNLASVLICDSFEMDSEVPSVIIPLFCRENIKLVKQGKLIIDTKPRPLVLEYSANLQAKVTTVPLDDEKSSEVWGPNLQRIELQYIGNKYADSYDLLFRAQTELAEN